MEREYLLLVSFPLSHFLSHFRVQIPAEAISFFIVARGITEEHCLFFFSVENISFFLQLSTKPNA